MSGFQRGTWGARVHPAPGAPQSLGMSELLPKSVGRKVETSFLQRKSHSRFFLFSTSSFQPKCHPAPILTCFFSLAATVAALQTLSHFSASCKMWTLTIGLVTNYSWKVIGRCPCPSQPKHSSTETSRFSRVVLEMSLCLHFKALSLVSAVFPCS